MNRRNFLGKGVLADTKTGGKAFLGKIAVNAGLPFSFGRKSDGLVQGMTMRFTLRGLDVPIMKAIPAEQLDQILQVQAVRKAFDQKVKN